MDTVTRQKLMDMFTKWSGEDVVEVQKLPRSGSYREYIRIAGPSTSAIGTFNADRQENEAFIYYSEKFFDKGFCVPQIYSKDLEYNIYLQQDLGDMTLFQYLTDIYDGEVFPDILKEKYKEILRTLPKLQVKGSQGLDFNKAYPRHSFDRQSMMWDLNYFKYYFLKLAKIGFNEQTLEGDFQTLTDFLLNTSCNYFLYRDFQSRNIMLKGDKIYFIDYQGGRQGALQYDLASLLYDSKANIPVAVREELLDFYLDELQKIVKVKRSEFLQYFQGYVLIRLMQAMGAYGFRGFYEKKTHFLKSIPYALKNLDYILDNWNLPIELSGLRNALFEVTRSAALKNINHGQTELKMTIKSFSYKKGLPVDTSGNGGGFIFDCRCLSNPGRYSEFKNSTGKDSDVIDFLADKNDVQEFLEKVFAVVDMAVDNYLERKFTHLMVGFGCTGGQHRSVYCAEKLAEHLMEKYELKADVSHMETHHFGED
ncbi:MAG: phosphotransferase [Candidatus Marinimicrobia bacterium]|nr:phosphotransferase [Candidatus Neomarinimicrobiota bacterium]